MRVLILTIFALSVTSAYADELQNLKLTPGMARQVDKNTLCTTSTKLVRNVPEAEKQAVYKEYGLQGNHTGYCSGKSGCEIDHLISLELGGSNDIRNLWPQPYDGHWNAHVKDRYENFLHAQICSGKISILDAQKEISTNWIDGYKKHPELPLP